MDFMKKIIIALVIIAGSCYGASAQVVPATNNPSNVNGLSKFAALPVLETYVPDDIVTKMKSMYGDKLYDITWVKSSANQDMYVVRTEENGNYQTQMINSDGTIKS